MKFSSIRSLQSCLIQGTGVTICPKKAAAGPIRDGQLAVPNWEENGAQIPVLMIWHREKWCSQILREFMKIIQTQITGE